MSTSLPSTFEFTRDQQENLGQAIVCLGEAFCSTRHPDSVKRKVNDALRYINKFNASVVPLVVLTEQEAEFSRNAHTYMRKFWDSPLATLLYRLISDDIGINVWYSFVKGAVANKFNLMEANEVAEEAYRDMETPDNLYMSCALGMWPEEDWGAMVELFAEWEKEEEARDS